MARISQPPKLQHAFHPSPAGCLRARQRGACRCSRLLRLRLNSASCCHNVAVCHAHDLCICILVAEKGLEVVRLQGQEQRGRRVRRRQAAGSGGGGGDGGSPTYCCLPLLPRHRGEGRAIAGISSTRKRVQERHRASATAGGHAERRPTSRAGCLGMHVFTAAESGAGRTLGTGRPPMFYCALQTPISLALRVK